MVISLEFNASLELSSCYRQGVRKLAYPKVAEYFSGLMGKGRWVLADEKIATR